LQRREELFRWQPFGGRPVKHLQFTPDGKQLAVARPDGGEVILVALDAVNRLLRQLHLEWMEGVPVAGPGPIPGVATRPEHLPRRGGGGSGERPSNVHLAP
jgi:hypothetical protein